MGLFGFGRKKHDDEAPSEPEDSKEPVVGRDNADEVVEDVDGQTVRRDEEGEDHPSFPDEVSETYTGREEGFGPWDVNDENVPDYDQYLDMGALYLPFLKGIELRVKANRATEEITGCTISYGSSSLELEAFAAPKSMGLWDDVRSDLLEANKNASQAPGIFGMEVRLPVSVKGGKSVNTRIVAVDGPRWTLRGIFSGKAATNPASQETQALNTFFADIVVGRGEEPLAPRDLIPMHQPVTPAERQAALEEQEGGDQKDDQQIPDKPKGPFSSDQESETRTTMSRGPMFSEVR